MLKSTQRLNFSTKLIRLGLYNNLSSKKLPNARYLPITQFSDKPNPKNEGNPLVKSFLFAAAAGMVVTVAFELGRKIFCEPLTSDPKVIEPISKTEFESNLKLPVSSQKDIDYQLVGLGVRAVTFLKFSAYALGLYFNPEDLKKFTQNLKEEFNQKKFIEDPIYADDIIDQLVASNARFVIQIVPVRPTSGAHLKGGLIRSLKAFHDAQTSQKILFPEQSKEVLESFSKFEHTFPKGQIPMNATLSYAKEISEAGVSVRVLDGQTDKGIVEGSWIIDHLLRAYLSGHKVVSADLRQSFAEFIKNQYQLNH